MIKQTIFPENSIFIASGSNLNQPKKNLKLAVNHIQHASDLTLIRTSKIYLSKAQTTANTTPQNNFYNQVLWIETDLSPDALLDNLIRIETYLGRIRNEKKWAARTLDLDILLYKSQNIQTDRLTIPHAQLIYRDFVLKPLANLIGDQSIIAGVSIATHLAHLKETFVYDGSTT